LDDEQVCLIWHKNIDLYISDNIQNNGVKQLKTQMFFWSKYTSEIMDLTIKSLPQRIKKFKLAPSPKEGDVDLIF
jgi:hypothetical protein